MQMYSRHSKEHRNQSDVDNILKSLYNKGFELLNSKRSHYSEMVKKALAYIYGRQFRCLEDILK